MFPGDSLLLVTGVFVFGGVIHAHLWFVALCLAVAVLVGGEVVYVIGRISGPRIFQSGRGHLLGSEAVERTNAFFGRWGVVAVVIARFVPVARTVVPLAAGVSNTSSTNAAGSAVVPLAAGVSEMSRPRSTFGR
ncbi:MAG: hypothetical protein B5766_05830 [Candidatus Lumbricidophila eiseniae]|uniref:VTT domain-containing protein n=1 Tax=Candidatus Lumbricidiphila eiseniae TaxID=1969409 RepID=A0A2A6FT20_9MICO|nr:MAG: hypothetical protein B5766_05830 [Candidatus Lumbricidophila eiseniae]